MELLKVIDYEESKGSFCIDSITYLLYSMEAMEEIFWIIASDFLRIDYAKFCYTYFTILRRS